MKLKGNARLADESYQEYQIRRELENRLLKRYLKGRLIHNSKLEGTYVRQKD